MMKHRRIALMLIICILAAAVCACAAVPEALIIDAANVPETQPTLTLTPTLQPTPAAIPTPMMTPIKTTQPDGPQQPDEGAAPTATPEKADEPHGPGTVRIRPGDTINSDIIPQLIDVFAMDRRDVEDALEDCRDSKLINDDLKDFRRMEGVIPPGTYAIGENEALEYYVNQWIDQAETRYDAIAAASSDPNDLEPHEQLALAAIVEWECLPNNMYDEIAAAVLNRVNDGSKIRSCVTTEYALGYMRPYTTSSDIKVESQYNTYYIRGVPIGPICVVEDGPLRATVAKSSDTSLYYFFNDYARREMLVFSSYDDFKAAAAISRDLFDETFDIDPYAIVEDKKSLFGYPQ